MTETPFSGDDISKVITTAQGWLKSQAPHLAPVDAQGGTCPCPLCKMVATVRDIDPDSAATWVNTAFAAFTSTLASYTAGSTTTGTSGEWAGGTNEPPTTVVDELVRPESPMDSDPTQS
jgi:hypothetical protein